MNTAKNLVFISCLLSLALLTAQCRSAKQYPTSPQILSADLYFDKVHGAWQAIMVANHTGLVHEGIYLEEPSDEDAIELVLLDEWSTDDDTAIEWVDLHIMESYGLDPTYEQIRTEWIEHLNHDIWVSTLRARELMDEGLLPPETGSAALNPDGAWSIDAQLETELFGLIAPGMPSEASRRAEYFAQITNSGPAVEASAFYATLYALAFFESDIPTLIDQSHARFPKESTISQITENVLTWHQQHPDDWRACRRLIRDAYDDDPMWWASRVNFASTIMTLLYGHGDMMETLTIGSLAGWDADNNVTTSAGLLGIINGYQQLPDAIRTASEIYYNEDVTGDLPKYQTVTDFARRTQALAEQQIWASGGEIKDGVYMIPSTAVTD